MSLLFGVSILLAHLYTQWSYIPLLPANWYMQQSCISFVPAHIYIYIIFIKVILFRNSFSDNSHLCTLWVLVENKDVFYELLIPLNYSLLQFANLYQIEVLWKLNFPPEFRPRHLFPFVACQQQFGFLWEVWEVLQSSLVVTMETQNGCWDSSLLEPS